jgi:BirA family biotin operon repressor/biotin-[acetyl-CoA-carboxylase] ligase
LWTFPADPAQLSGLSLVVGLAVIRAMSGTTGRHRRQGTRCGLKWPNDVLIQRANGSFAKAGGILIESAMRAAAGGGKELAVVLGIGLNCSESGALSERVTDQTVATVSELFDTGVTPETVLPVLLDALFDTLGEFSSQGFASFRSEWNAHNLWQDQPVQIREGDAVLHEGLCRGVDDEGALCIETAAGIQRIVSGDVSLRKV